MLNANRVPCDIATISRGDPAAGITQLLSLIIAKKGGGRIRAHIPATFTVRHGILKILRTVVKI